MAQDNKTEQHDDRPTPAPMDPTVKRTLKFLLGFITAFGIVMLLFGR